MQSFNKAFVVGYLGRDPELRYAPSGNAVCGFSVATTEKRRNRDGDAEDVTTWFKVTTWGRQAEVCHEYLAKGSPVYVEGRLTVEEWTDREGNNRFTLALNATDVRFLASRDRDPDESESRAARAAQAPARERSRSSSSRREPEEPHGDDEIPF